MHISRKYLQNTYLIKNLYPEYKKNSQNSVRKQSNFKTMSKRFEKIFTKDTQMTSKSIKRCLTLQVSKGIKTKTTLTLSLHINQNG